MTTKYERRRPILRQERQHQMTGSHTPVEHETDVIRHARLFEAGEYPDKGLNVTPDDLDIMSQNFCGPAPIRVEHADGPVHFGHLERVWREGNTLMGALRFSRAAWDLVRQSGARLLSIAVDKATLKISEVSLVKNPRVPNAVILNHSPAVVFAADIEDSSPIDGGTMNDKTNANNIPLKEDGNKNIDRQPQLQFAEMLAEVRLNKLKAEGRVAPGAEKYARALLSHGGSETVKLSDDKSADVAEVFLMFLESQPSLALFGEMAEAGKSGKYAFGQEDVALFELLGVTPDEASRHCRK